MSRLFLGNNSNTEISRMMPKPLMSLHSMEPLLILLFGAFIVMTSLAFYAHYTETKHNFMQAGMYFIVGRMGAGKSYLMTWAAYHAQRKGREVYTNMESLKFCKGYVKNWDDVLALTARAYEIKANQWRPLVICLDEIHLWWRSYEWEVDGRLEEWCSQLRKHGILLLGTTQDWAFMSKRLRRLAFGVWLGRGAVHGHRYKLYSPAGFEQYQRKLPPHEGMLYIMRRKKIMAGYDTREVVKSVDAPDRKIKLSPLPPPPGTISLTEHKGKLEAIKLEEIGTHGGE